MRRIRSAAMYLLLVQLSAVGCAGRREPPAVERASGSGSAPGVALSVHVFADTARGGRLSLSRGPGVRVWLSRVTPTRMPLPSLVPPPAQPESLPPLEESAPAPEVDPGLKPPVLREPGVLLLPSRRHDEHGTVELDVRVDESGRVSDATWAGGNTDTALVAAARRCALSMRFYPAVRAGQRVSVWCRQRFDFAGAVR